VTVHLTTNNTRHRESCQPITQSNVQFKWHEG